MSPELKTRISPEKIDQVVEVLKNNGLVILPTDTVYGLFTKAFNDSTYIRIEAIKKSRNTPYSVTFSNTKAMFEWYGSVDLIRRNIIGELTPGPVTVVLPYIDKVPSKFHYPEHGVGLRVGSNEVLNRVMDNLDFPLWSTSANKAGDVAPVRLSEVGALLMQRIDSSIDGGDSDYLTSSDVIDLRKRPFSLLRKGPWYQKIDKILSKTEDEFYIVVVCTGNLCRSPLAEYLIKRKMDSIPNANVVVESAGVYAVEGYPATEEMVIQGHRLNVDLAAHAAQKLTHAIIERAGLILSVSPWHSNKIISDHPQAAQKIRLLGEHINQDEIEDPYQRGEEAYIESADFIERAVNSWTNEFIASFSHFNSD